MRDVTGSSAPAPARRRHLSSHRPRPQPRGRGWWGAGPPPTERWPGRTIEIPSVWNYKRGRWESPDGQFYYDKAAADLACDFFPEYLSHHIGEFAGQPFTLLPYQAYLLTKPIFGWKQTRDDLRRFRKVFAFLPKGAGKSPWASGTGLFLMLCDREPAAEIYAMAGDKNQARIVHTNAKVMVEDSPDLFAMCEVLRDSIFCPTTRSVYQVLSADASTKHGFRPHGAIFDEFHGQPNRDLYEAIKKSMPKRRQPLLLMITHAGTDDESICVAPDTRILTTDLRWVRAGDLRVGDHVVGFDEHRDSTAHRTWLKSEVLAHQVIDRPCYELVLSDGTRVVCSAEHQWLIQTAGRRVLWRQTQELELTDTFFKVAEPWEEDRSWEAGYLSGLFDSEGHLTQTVRSKCLCGFTQVEGRVQTLGRQLLDARGFRYGVYRDEERQAAQVMVTRKRDVIRLLGSVRPARLLDKFQRIAYGPDGLRFKAHAHPHLVSKTFVGVQPVVGMKTTTRTYVAEGLASHNCYEEYEYAKRVLSGTVPDPTCLPVIFEADPEEDWADPGLLGRVNPGHGVTIQSAGVLAELTEAKAEPRKKNDYLRFHLNRWTNQATAWLSVDWWDACPARLESDEALKLVPCAAGLDLAQKHDLACLSVVFRHPVAEAVTVEVVPGTATDGTEAKTPLTLNYRITILPFFWIPEETMVERERHDGIPYSEWVRQGFVTATEGGVIDYNRIYTDITQRIVPRFPLLKQGLFGYDPAFATDLATNLRDRAGLKVAEILQNYSHLSEASQVFEALIKARRVSHGGHRVLRNHVETVAIKTDDAGRIRPVRPKKTNKRVDGVLASIMGLKMVALAALPGPQYVVYTFGGPK